MMMPLIAEQFKYLSACVEFFKIVKDRTQTISILRVNTTEFEKAFNAAVTQHDALKAMFDNQATPSAEQIDALKSDVTQLLKQFIAGLEAVHTHKDSIVACLTRWQCNVRLRLVAAGDSATADNVKDFLSQVSEWLVYLEGSYLSKLLELARKLEIEWPRLLSNIERSVTLNEGADAKKFEFVPPRFGSPLEFKKIYVRYVDWLSDLGLEYIEIMTPHVDGHNMRIFLGDKKIPDPNAEVLIESQKFAELKAIIQGGNLELLKPHTDFILECLRSSPLGSPQKYLQAHHMDLGIVSIYLPKISIQTPYREIDKLITEWRQHPVPSHKVIYLYRSHWDSCIDERVLKEMGSTDQMGMPLWTVHFELRDCQQRHLKTVGDSSAYSVVAAIVPSDAITEHPCDVQNAFYLTRPLLYHEYLGVIAASAHPAVQPTLTELNLHYEELFRAMFQNPYDPVKVNAQIELLDPLRSASVSYPPTKRVMMYFYHDGSPPTLDATTFNQMHGSTNPAVQLLWRAYNSSLGFRHLQRDSAGDEPLFSADYNREQCVVAASVPVGDVLPVLHETYSVLRRPLQPYEYVGVITVIGRKQLLTQKNSLYNRVLLAELNKAPDVLVKKDRELHHLVDLQAARVAPPVPRAAAVPVGAMAPVSATTMVDAKGSASGSGGVQRRLADQARTAGDPWTASYFTTLSAILNLSIESAESEPNSLRSALYAQIRATPNGFSVFGDAKLVSGCWRVVLEYIEQKMSLLLKDFADTHLQPALKPPTVVAPKASFLTGTAAAGSMITTAVGFSANGAAVPTAAESQPKDEKPRPSP